MVGDGALARAFADGLGALGAEVAARAEAGACDAAALAGCGLFVLCDGGAWAEAVDRFIAATRDRRFPVEAWVARPARDRAFQRQARRCYADDRLYFRPVALPEEARHPVAAARAARTALFFVRRGFRWAPAGAGAALAWFRFRFSR